MISTLSRFDSYLYSTDDLQAICHLHRSRLRSKPYLLPLPDSGFFGISNSSALRALEGACLEDQQSTITPEVAASVFEVAPCLAPRPNYHLPPVPINPRDLEIYRLRTEEMRTIPSLAEEFWLKEKSVWGICTKMRKLGKAYNDVLKALCGVMSCSVMAVLELKVEKQASILSLPMKV